MKFIKRMTVTLLAVILLVLSVPVPVFAEEVPYDSYNYDYWKEITFTPAPYVPDGSISGTSLGIGAFSKPQDFCVSPNGDLYIADTGNNRIVVVDGRTRQVSRIIDSFILNGQESTFNAPSGVCVSETNQIYIADRENCRIVVLNQDGSFLKIVDNPVSDVLPQGFIFKPLRISVDYADRIYCVAQNMFQGIMVFENNGDFSGFFGTINVHLSLWEKFWKRVATKEERENQTLYIATEFTGIDIDEGGFVYATNIDETGVQGVRRINPRGEDVIKKGRNENLGGDLNIGGAGPFAGPSQITDVVYRGRGIYSLLDRKRGRIFTYDHEGNLLYIFGTLGTQAGTFQTPVAIEQWGDQLLVLDSSQQQVCCFAATEYGSLINEAVGLRYDGDEALAVPLWKRVLELDENNELANSGLGKAYLSDGDNQKAMEYLLRGMNREYYSVAFKRFRADLLRTWLGPILTGAAVLAVGILVLKKVLECRQYKKKKGGEK